MADEKGHITSFARPMYHVQGDEVNVDSVVDGRVGFVKGRKQHGNY